MMFGGGSGSSLHNTGLLGPRMTGGGSAPPSPNGLFTGPPPKRYDPDPVNTKSTGPLPQWPNINITHTGT